MARWGRYVFLTEERLAKAEAFFSRHGGKIIVVARFVEGLRQANGIIAGIGGMAWHRFVAFNMLGAALWVGCWVSVGYFAGRHITAIYDYITRYSLYALIVAAVLVAAWIIRRVYKHRAGAREHELVKSAGKAEATETAGTAGSAETAGDPGTAGDAETAEATGATGEKTGTTRTDGEPEGRGQQEQADSADESAQASDRS